MNIIEKISNEMKGKSFISNDEQEMLDIINELTKNPFDRETAEKKSNEMYTKHKDLYLMVGSLSNVVKKASYELSDQEIYDNLLAQLILLYQKHYSK